MLLDLMPDYSDLVSRYGLKILTQPADWQLTADGDLAVTRGGGIFVGSPAFNTMHRIVGAWRYNQPTMQLLLRLLCQMRESRPEIEEQVQAALGEKAKVKWAGPILEVDMF